jgi:cbb3-type cytochrome oxidase subunit 3
VSRLLGPLFEDSPLLVLPLFGLLLFFLTFVMVVVRLFSRDRAAFDALARQPLDDLMLDDPSDEDVASDEESEP